MNNLYYSGFDLLITFERSNDVLLALLTYFSFFLKYNITLYGQNIRKANSYNQQIICFRYTYQYL